MKRNLLSTHVEGSSAANNSEGHRVLGLALRLMIATFAAVILSNTAFTQLQAWADNQPDRRPHGASSKLVQDPSAIVLRLSSSDEHGSTIGTGFSIGNCVLTNDHVVANTSYISIDQISPGTSDVIETWGSALAASSPADIAVVSGGEGPVGAAATLSSEPLSIGQAVTMIGYRGGNRMVKVDGSIHALVDGSVYGIAGPVMLIDQLTSEGMSGGPVMNEAGEVVGMLSRVDELTGLTVAIPVGSLRVQLEKVATLGGC